MNVENMENATEKNSEMSFENPGKTSILRCCTLLLAAVSFYATAQGMIEYVFAEEWQAYAASFAIQGMLVALNFYLPARMKKVKKIVSKMAVLVMAGIVTFCSSWFSYVYIAGKMFESSWEEKGHLTVEKEYRTQLYKTQDYINGYLEELNNNLAVSIQNLYVNIEKLQGGGSATEVSATAYDWAAEEKSLSDILETAFTQEDPVYTNISSELGRMIDSIKNWEEDSNNTNKQESALTSVQDEETLINVRKGQAEEELKRVEETITSYEERTEVLNEAIRNNRNNEADNDPNIIERNRLAQRIENAQNERDNWQVIITVYNEIVIQLQNYQSYIEKEEANNTNVLINDLREIQNQMIAREPDATEMVNLAADLYSRLREEDTSNASGQYTETLNEMQLFSHQLTTYAKLKEAQTQIDSLLENMDDRNTGDNANEEGAWEKQWNANIRTLKNEVSSLPVYSINNDKEVEEWMKYDRATVVLDMDAVQERYLNQHNAAEQGLIYFNSPYWYLALFSFMLATFFDVAGFITGVFIEKEESKKTKESYAVGKPEAIEESSIVGQVFEKRAKTQLYNQYFILTGDYNHVDNEDIYIAYDCDKRVLIKQKEGQFFKQGVYMMKDDSEQLEKAQPQEIYFAVDPKEARDGTYVKSKFHYKDQMLWSEDKDGNRKYITNVERTVWVYSLNGDELHKDVVGKLDMKDYGSVTLALNKERTRVATIYIVYDIIEEVAQEEVAQEEVAQEEAAQEEAAQEEVAQEEAAQEETAQEKAAQREITQEEIEQGEENKRIEKVPDKGIPEYTRSQFGKAQYKEEKSPREW